MSVFKRFSLSAALLAWSTLPASAQWQESLVGPESLPGGAAYRPPVYAPGQVGIVTGQPPVSVGQGAPPAWQHVSPAWSSQAYQPGQVAIQPGYSLQGGWPVQSFPTHVYQPPLRIDPPYPAPHYQAPRFQAPQVHTPQAHYR